MSTHVRSSLYNPRDIAVTPLLHFDEKPFHVNMESETKNIVIA